MNERDVIELVSLRDEVRKLREAMVIDTKDGSKRPVVLSPSAYGKPPFETINACYATKDEAYAVLDRVLGLNQHAPTPTTPQNEATMTTTDTNDELAKLRAEKAELKEENDALWSAVVTDNPIVIIGCDNRDSPIYEIGEWHESIDNAKDAVRRHLKIGKYKSAPQPTPDQLQSLVNGILQSLVERLERLERVAGIES